jgi:hypothetical protein
MSAAEQHEVGCPLPAAVVAVMEWMRSWLAMPFKSSMSVSIMERGVYARNCESQE